VRSGVGMWLSRLSLTMAIDISYHS
jgi:hypothetical protein